MRCRWLFLFLILALYWKGVIASDYRVSANGWLLFKDDPVWGISAYSELWKSGRRINITKVDPAGTGPTRTEEFQGLTDSMLAFGFPVLEHMPGLWNDLRRGDHTKECRDDDNFDPVVFEFPWARSGQGRACDGGSLYDLEAFNPRYFNRIAEFARIARDKGVVLRLDYYLQHNFLEAQTHYVDYPWRPGNSIQDTGMPDYRPAANAFYDVSHPVRRNLHRRFIRHTLETAGDYDNVIHFTPAEYTGGKAFVEFWMDTIIEWEAEAAGRDVRIGVSAPKDVLDEILENPEYGDHVDAIDLRYFWYSPDGEPYAVRGGEQKPGSRRYDGKLLPQRTSAEQVYNQTIDYRQAWPGKLIFHAVGTDPEYTYAYFMAGGSFNSIKLEYDKDQIALGEYGRPSRVTQAENLYRFVRDVLGGDLAGLAPERSSPGGQSGVYILSGTPGALFYNPQGYPMSGLVTGRFQAARLLWFNPGTGEMREQQWRSGNDDELIPPDDDYVFLYIKYPD